MLKLESDKLVFSFPEVHEDAVLEITFERTLRIPDDGKNYSLPPSLGHFPVRMVDDFKDKIPEKWTEHGGVMLPMFQAEALWINFNAKMTNRGNYPFAVKVHAGMVSAITGASYTKEIVKDDYLIIPTQKWIDGFVVDGGQIRQFIAAPLGSGFAVEEQVTKEAKYGGIQIEVYPMKKSEFEKLPRQARVLRNSYGGGGMFSAQSLPGTYSMVECLEEAPIACAAAAASADSDDLVLETQEYSRGIDLNIKPDMSLAAGGTMTQQIFKDEYGIDKWETETQQKCFVHLANSMTWRAITGINPPQIPLTSKEYTRYGYPWFDYYQAEVDSVQGTDVLKDVKSALQVGMEKGVHILPENESVKGEKVIDLSPKKIVDKSEVRVGSW